MNKSWWDRWIKRTHWIQAAAELGLHGYARETGAPQTDPDRASNSLDLDPEKGRTPSFA